MLRSHPSRILVAFAVALVASLEAGRSGASEEAPATNDSEPASPPDLPAEPPLPSPPPSPSPSPSPPADLGPTEFPTPVPPAPTAPAAPADAAFPADAPVAPRSAPEPAPSFVEPVGAPRTAAGTSPPNEGRSLAPNEGLVQPRSLEPLPPNPEPRHRDSSDGLFGPIRIGFLVGVGLPNLLNFGGTAKITRFLGAGINVGLIPSARLSYYGDATLSYQEYDIYGRIYPFGGGFFIGAAAGYSKVRGTLRGKVDLTKYASGQLPIPGGLLPPGYQLPASIDYEARGSVRTLALTPQIGYLHTFGSGFSIGLDVGAQIPIAASEIVFESSVSPPEVAELKPFKDQQAKVRDTLETVGRTPLPSLNFRIGWLL